MAAKSAQSGGVLHQGFLEALDQLPYMAMAEVVTNKLREQGVKLTKPEKKRLVEVLKRDNFSIRNFKFGPKTSNRRIHIKISKAETKRVISSIKSVHRRIPRLMKQTVKESAKSVGRRLDLSWPRYWRYYRLSEAGFQKRLLQRWRGPLGKLDRLIVMLREMGEGAIDELHRDKKKPFTASVQSALLAKACLTASEIAVLLKAGFADGAMARWRSLHEIAIVMDFIGRDELLAERFAKFEVVESIRSANRLNEHAARLKERPISEAELQSMLVDRSKLVERFGDSFAKGDYGWAAEKLGDSHPTFEKIEKAVSLAHFRPYFRMASHNIHAGPKGNVFRLGLMHRDGTLLGGASNYGLADPGQNTTISLHYIAATFCGVCPIIDVLVTAKIIGKVSRLAGPEFVAVQKTLRRDDLRLRKQRLRQPKTPPVSMKS